MKVEVDTSDNSIRLTTDKVWKTGDKAAITFPAAPELPGTLAELTCASEFGEAVGEDLLKEFLIGELREKINPAKAFDLDNLDKNIRPAAGDKWKLCKNEDGNFDLTKHVGSLENVLVHACTYVYSDVDRKVQLLAGSDDCIQIIVNGKVVLTSPGAHALSADQDRARDVALSKGWNTILLVIPQGSGGWGFCLRIRNEQGDSPPMRLRYTAELPAEK